MECLAELLATDVAVLGLHRSTDAVLGGKSGKGRFGSKAEGVQAHWGAEDAQNDIESEAYSLSLLLGTYLRAVLSWKTRRAVRTAAVA